MKIGDKVKFKSDKNTPNPFVYKILGFTTLTVRDNTFTSDYEVGDVVPVALLEAHMHRYTAQVTTERSQTTVAFTHVFGDLKELEVFTEKLDKG